MDLGLALQGVTVAILGLGFAGAGVAELLVDGSWNVLLLAGGPAFVVVGAALAFFHWVER